MLSRRHLRIKVMNALYALEQKAFKDVEQAESYLFDDISKVYNVYLSLLYSLTEVINYSVEDLEITKSKYIFKEEHKLSSDQLFENRISKCLIEHCGIEDLLKKAKVKFSIDEKLIKSIFIDLKNSEPYQNYLLNTDKGKKDDLYILEYLFLDILISNENFHQHMEDNWLSWEEDQGFLVKLILKTLERAANKPNKPQLISKTSKFWDEEKDFVKNLFQKGVYDKSIFQKYIIKHTKNWEIDRITTLDSILLNMAIAELMYFDKIPARVTLDEYIEISKEYSTPKSKEFINGLLDRIMKDLVKEGLINREVKQILR